MNKFIITDVINTIDCKYYEEVGGIEYQGMWEYSDCCYKYYVHCYNKKICPYKIKQLILHPIKILKIFIQTYKSRKEIMSWIMKK